MLNVRCESGDWFVCAFNGNNVDDELLRNGIKHINHLNYRVNPFLSLFDQTTQKSKATPERASRQRKDMKKTKNVKNEKREFCKSWLKQCFFISLNLSERLKAFWFACSPFVARCLLIFFFLIFSLFLLHPILIWTLKALLHVNSFRSRRFTLHCWRFLFT